MPKTCECHKINWADKFKENYVHDDSKCNCCQSKMNRNELTYEEFKKTCQMCSKGKKHVYQPCTWY